MSTAEQAAVARTADPAVTRAMPTDGGAAVAVPAPEAVQDSAQNPAEVPAAKGAVGSRIVGNPRRIRLTVSRIDPWSTTKIAFLLSVAIGIAMVVATAVLWTILSGMGVFTKVNSMIGEVIQEGGRPFDIMDFVGFGRIISLAIVFAVFDVILMTALATLAAFLYNVSSSLVGGVQVTLTDD